MKNVLYKWLYILVVIPLTYIFYPVIHYYWKKEKSSFDGAVKVSTGQDSGTDHWKGD